MRLKTQQDKDNLHVKNLEEQIRAKEIGFGNAIDQILKGEQQALKEIVESSDLMEDFKINSFKNQPKAKVDFQAAPVARNQIVAHV